jgi:hypothetical protein
VDVKIAQSILDRRFLAIGLVIGFILGYGVRALISHRRHLRARVYRRVFARDHHEGDRINALGKLLIGLPLIVTRVLDDILTEDQNLAKLTFGKDALIDSRHRGAHERA